MKTKLPSKFSTRMASMEDLPQIHALEEKKSLHYFGYPGYALERLENDYRSPGFDPARSVRLVFDPDGTLAGLAEVWDTSDPAVHPIVWVSVDPFQEELGIEAFLLEWIENRAREGLQRLDPELRVAMRSYVDHTVTSVHEALREAGFMQIRHSFRMRIELDQPPREPAWPDGIRLRPYRPEVDARAVYQADDEAFQDHFGYVKEDPDSGFEKYMHHMAGDDSYDPDLWFLAVDEMDQIAGFCICRRYGSEDKDAGYISSLGVLRPWRRRGIAQALLYHAFGEFYKRGKTKVDLGVDADSLTGATDLYKKVGMGVHRQYDLYEKVLREGVDLSVNSLESVEQ